jgi:5'-3' exonuclease
MIHRARYGFGDGPHSVTFNFFRQLKSEIEKHKADVVYMVDEGRPSQSLSVDANYKGNRTAVLDDNFLRQKREIFEIVKTVSGIKYAHHQHFECDDVIAHLATVVHRNDHITIVSSDSDFTQLLEDRDDIQLWNPVKKKFVEKVPNYAIRKSFIGDPTDNVQGVPGVGPVKAATLASDAGARLLFFEKNPNTQEIFERAYKMIRFKPVQDEEMTYIDSTFDEQKLLAEFTNRKFKSIIGSSWPKWVKTFGGINVQC